MHDEMGDKKKQKKAPPPTDLDKRFQIRCAVTDLKKWEEQAQEDGFIGVGAWIRKTLNAALRPARAR